MGAVVLLVLLVVELVTDVMFELDPPAVVELSMMLFCCCIYVYMCVA